jgi:hypothetical protein
MSAVVEAVVGAVGDVAEFVGDIGETVVEAAGDVVEVVGDVAQGVVQGAVDDPLGTIVKVGTAIYAPYLLPVVTAGHVVANGGDIGEALQAGAISWATQGITQGLSDYIPTTEVGSYLADVAQSTGIEALPQAVVRGLATTAGQTAAGVAQGQDFEDALTRGLTSGVGSAVGRIAGSEIDTGSRLADRLIGQTVAGGTTAALRGKDVETGAGSALASGLLDYGFNQGAKGIASLGKEQNAPTSTNLAEYDYSAEAPEQPAPPPLLASGVTATDAALSPTEELMRQMVGNVSVYDPATGLPVQTEEEKQYTQQLLEALYPDRAVENVSGLTDSEPSQAFEPESIKGIDSSGNVYDDSGEVISSAFDLGFVKGSDAQGNEVWITNTGEFIPARAQEESATDFSSQVVTPSDFATQMLTPSSTTSAGDIFGTGESESAADYPQEIINNPDGSVTVIENDGTQRIFNVDGSVTLIGAGGEKTEEYAKPAEPTEAEKAASSSTNTLGNIAGVLLDGATSGSSGGSRTARMPRWVPGMAALGAGVAAGIDAANTPTQDSNPFSYNPYSFDFGQQRVNAANEGVAYGQRFFDPRYTKQAAEGGLMSIPNTVQSTLTNNGLKDPNSSVQMYSKGGNIDNETMNIVKHLKTGGAPMHHIAGFLDYRQKKMAQGGHLGGYSDGGRMLKGPGDGMSDDIPASIAGRQPARLANEEFVIPADVVSHLGNGSSEAGAKVLYEMMDKVRKARTGHTKQGKQINPQKLMPKVRK